MNSDATFTGIAAPLLRINVDTDAIIPSREMKRVAKTGLSDGLFANWRYLDAATRKPDPAFLLNQPPFDRSSILLSGRNFGCGSSREHAVWALKEWGIRAIIAPSFGSIFATNCVNNGVLPIRLDEQVIDGMATQVAADPAGNTVTIDLANRSVSQGGSDWTFDIGDREQQMLLRGLSPIAMTLESDERIRAFEQQYLLERPWARL